LEGVTAVLDTVREKIEKLRRPARALGDTFRDTFGAMGIGMLEPFMRAWDKATSTMDRGRRAAEQARDNLVKGAGVFKQRMVTFEAEKGPNEATGFMKDLAGLIDPKTGTIPKNAISKMDPALLQQLKERANVVKGMKQADLSEMVGGISGRGAGISSRISAMALQSAAKSIAAEEGIGATASGGIAATVGGGGEAAVGAGEMGAGALGEAAGGGPIGIFIGAISLLRDAFDGMIKSNQQIFDKLGQSGLFAGRTSGAAAFQNVRMNLTPGMNLYGQTYEKNIDIAAAINKFGVSVADLSETNNRLEQNIIGKAGGRPGEGIAATIFGGARLAGLDQTAATEQIMKLLQQYHLSLEGTDAFFNKLNIDIRAAGITSTKYIQILDDISGQFDHMARGVNDVTSALRMLGHTGLLTSEQVEDAMKAMITTKTTPEMGAFMALHMTRGTQQMLQATQGVDVEQQADDAYKALLDAYKSAGFSEDQARAKLGQSGVTKESLVSNPTTAGMATMAAARDLEGKGDATKKQAVGATLNQLTAGQQALQQTNLFVKNPTTRNALEFAFAPNQSPAMTAAMNITKLQQTLMKAGVGKNVNEAMSKFILHPEEVVKRSMEINKFATAFQLNPEDIPKLRTLQLAASGARINEAMMGTGNVDDHTYKKIAGYLGLKPTATREDVMKDLKGSASEQQKAMEGLAGDWETFSSNFEAGGAMAKVFADSAKKQGEELSDTMKKSLGEALTTTDDYLKQITQILINLVYGTLTKILDFFGGNTMPKAEDIADIQAKIIATGPGTIQGDMDKGQEEIKTLDKYIIAAQQQLKEDQDKKAGPDKIKNDLLNLSGFQGQRQNLVNTVTAMQNTINTVKSRGIATGNDVTGYYDMEKRLREEVMIKQGYYRGTTDIPPAAGPGVAAGGVNAQVTTGTANKAAGNAPIIVDASTKIAQGFSPNVTLPSTFPGGAHETSTVSTGNPAKDFAHMLANPTLGANIKIPGIGGQ